MKCVEDQEKKEMCQSRWIIYVPEITFKNILFAFRFTSPENLMKANITLSATSFVYMNDEYTEYLVGLKYIFLFISIVAFIVFYLRLRKLP